MSNAVIVVADEPTFIVVPDNDANNVVAVVPSNTTTPSPGGGSGDNSGHFTHVQATPAAQWSIVHNLGRRPSVVVTTSAGDVVLGDIHHVSTNQLTLNFSGAFSGTADLN